MTQPRGSTLGTRLLNTVRRMASEEATHVSLQAADAALSAEVRADVRAGAVALGEAALTTMEKAELANALPKGSSGLPANIRFHKYRAALILVMDRLNVRRSLRSGGDRTWLRGVVQRAHSWLGERRIIDLSKAELAALEAETRAYLIETAPGFVAARTAARQTARTIKGAVAGPIVASRVELPEGAWYFFHTDASHPIVVSELFVPRAPVSGTPVPARPSFPARPARAGRSAGGGDPRWLLDDATVVTKAPTLTARPAQVLSGLPVAALTDGPALLVDQLARAELRQLSRTWVPLTNKEVRFVGVPQAQRRTLGLGIDSIEYLPVPPNAGNAFDLRVRIKGRLGREAVRIGDEDILPLPSALGLKNHARLHLWGAIFGDSTPAGIAYGLEKFNQLQLISIETYLKAGRRGNTAAVELEATAFIKLRNIDGDTYPFLKEVRYEYTVDGKRYRYRVHTDSGVPQIETPVLIP